VKTTAPPASAPVAAAPKPPQPVTITVPAGTAMTVRLHQPISTKTSKKGEKFTATVSEPVAIEGTTIIPRGAQVTGVVADAASAGRFKGGAKLQLQLVGVAVGNTPYPISASVAQDSKGRGKRTAVAAGGGAGVGALVGGIAGGGKGAAIGALVGGSAGTVGSAMTGERDISLPVESVLSFALDKPLRVTVMPAHTAAQ